MITYGEYLIKNYNNILNHDKYKDVKWNWAFDYLCQEEVIDNLINMEENEFQLHSHRYILYQNKRRNDIKISLKKEYERYKKINIIIE